MLGPQDLKGIAQLIDPENESQLQNIEEEVDISHLDYQYVATCNNRNELGTLLNYLRHLQMLNIEVEKKDIIQNWKMPS
jgi:hypothetical protein